MPDGLKKKIGPLPIWAWAVIAGGLIGAMILFSRRGTADPAEGEIPLDPVTDPTTGLPFAGEGGSGGLTGGGGAPVATDWSGLTDALQQSGLFAPVGTSAPGLIDLATGHRYYDPTTGDVVDGPEAAAVQQVTPGKTAAAAKPTPLDRAMTAVQSGRIGPINRKRLQNAGYTDNQIDFHLKHKTPLQKPGKTPASAKSPSSSAPHSVNNHTNVQAPRHVPSALDRAMQTVTTGKIGPVNTQRLLSAGYTQAQIDYHLKRKTPLGAPKGK